MRLCRCLILLVLLWAPLLAHEMGAMHVTVTFLREGVWQADIVLDLEHVPLAQRPLEAAPEAARTAWSRAFLAACAPAFDGRAATVDRAVFQGPKDGQPSQWGFHLEGPIPHGVKNFTWAHGQNLGAYLLTLQHQGDTSSRSQWLEGQRSAPFALDAAVVPRSRLSFIGQYLRLGFTHILPDGLDHILFVLGLFLLSLHWRSLLAQTGAFTVAHSITLGLTMVGAISLPPRVVEPAIALSIAYVAIENVVTGSLKPWRIALVFGFGLVHGMGFADVLKDLGLPRGEILPALVSFNVGVEAAQVTVLLAAYLVLGWWAGGKPWYRRRVVIPASVVIAAVALRWTVLRLVA